MVNGVSNDITNVIAYGIVNVIGKSIANIIANGIANDIANGIATWACQVCTETGRVDPNQCGNSLKYPDLLY